LLSEPAGRPGGDAEEVAAELREQVAGQPDGEAVGDRIAQLLGVGDRCSRAPTTGPAPAR